MADDFKQTLWKAADKLRAQMDAAEYKHIVLGLIFLKYISDTFVKQQDRRKSMVLTHPLTSSSVKTPQSTQMNWKNVTITFRTTCSGCLRKHVGKP